MKHSQKINQLLGHTFQNNQKISTDIFSSHKAIKIQLKGNFRGLFKAISLATLVQKIIIQNHH